MGKTNKYSKMDPFSRMIAKGIDWKRSRKKKVKESKSKNKYGLKF